MYLIPKKINIRTGNKYIAVLHDDTAHTFDLHVGDRIIVSNRKIQIRAILDVTSSIKKNTVELFAETWDQLKIKSGDKIKISICEKPISVTYIKEKLFGTPLSTEKINEIVKDIVEDDLSDIELTYFVSGCFCNGLSDRETADLTRAIVKYGNRLVFKDKFVVDKHCIGGVPGNRTTLVVVPIIIAAGLRMPKTSSRSITSPSGTGDTMEILANVKNDAKKLYKIAQQVGGFITWGGGVDLAAADDYMIRVRHPLSLDPEGMLLASIMAKKYSVSANHVLIDVPIGETVKIKTKKDAQHLRKRFLKIAHLLGMKARVIITDGSQPIGRGIGPLLEAIDILKVLKNEKDAPQDLKEKSVMMAGILLELCKKARKGWGEKIAQEILESGAAWKKMQDIIRAQGAKRIPSLANSFYDLKTAKKGIIRKIDNKQISHICRIAGAPKDVKAGIFIYKKLKEKVKKGQVLYRIYANSPERLKYASSFALNHNGYTIK